MALAQALIRRRSVTPADDGALDVVQGALESLGFQCWRLPFAEVDNLFARRGTAGPHFCFAGHTDVVPPGDEALWRHPPFGAEVHDGVLYGRGAQDMKGDIAAFIAAIPDDLPGSLSLLITGDEEGPSVNGTVKVLEWMAANGQIPDACLVGEPTSKAVLGDTLKIGRRGSMNAYVTVHGTQGHSAYPQKADNPVHRLVAAIAELTSKPIDDGSEWFEATTLQVTGLQVDNTATNVIPAEARCFLNIRFNERHTSASLTEHLREVLARHAPRHDLRVVVSGESFVTQPGPFVDALVKATARATNITPQLDTGGGTSDARFITRYCPVAELGLVGSTMHKTDECVPVAELEALSRLYANVIREFFS
ncbi:succinyl-diaminopimelate desuccinylase [Rhodovarius crocodyli]|uniref:Succinyl-diaminopimelate desuccinylase n=1 Tax=Rhodovarius crocodyli TaxID=1979269 RepID=A0A437MJZ3_9PROT|nr:succinyl-diaminopimelate desuccinylase [Rhodovarius crocodyli]